ALGFEGVQGTPEQGFHRAIGTTASGKRLDDRLVPPIAAQRAMRKVEERRARRLRPTLGDPLKLLAQALATNDRRHDRGGVAQRGGKRRSRLHPKRDPTDTRRPRKKSAADIRRAPGRCSSEISSAPSPQATTSDCPAASTVPGAPLEGRTAALQIL